MIKDMGWWVGSLRTQRIKECRRNSLINKIRKLKDGKSIYSLYRETSKLKVRIVTPISTHRIIPSPDQHIEKVFDEYRKRIKNLLKPKKEVITKRYIIPINKKWILLHR